MRRRITLAILGVLVPVIVLFGLPLALVGQRLIDERSSLRLERRAVLMSRQVPGDFADNADPVELPSQADTVFALYNARGDRVTGTGPAEADAVVAAALDNRVRLAELGEHQVVAIPIVDHEVVVGVLRASQPTTVADAQVTKAALLILLLGVAVTSAGMVLAAAVAGRLTRPIRALRNRAVALGNGDFRLEPDPSRIPELDDADAALATTARRLDDLLARERAFSTDASHQLRTPLAALRTNIETELQFPRVDTGIVLGELLDDITTLEATITDLLRFARASSVVLQAIDLGPLLEELRDRYHGPLADLGRPFVITSSPGPSVLFSEGSLLAQAIGALVDNAIVHGAGEVRVAVRVAEEAVTIQISDEGPGFRPRAPAGKDFRTGDAHGFGLALIRRLVEASQGRLVLRERGPHPRIDVVLRTAPAPRAPA